HVVLDHVAPGGRVERALRVVARPDVEPLDPGALHPGRPVPHRPLRLESPVGARPLVEFERPGLLAIRRVLRLDLLAGLEPRLARDAGAEPDSLAGPPLDVVGGLDLLAALLGRDRTGPDRARLAGRPPGLVRVDPSQGLLVGEPPPAGLGLARRIVRATLLL